MNSLIKNEINHIKDKIKNDLNTLPLPRPMFLAVTILFNGNSCEGKYRLGRIKSICREMKINQFVYCYNADEIDKYIAAIDESNNMLESLGTIIIKPFINQETYEKLRGFVSEDKDIDFNSCLCDSITHILSCCDLLSDNKIAVLYDGNEQLHRLKEDISNIIFIDVTNNEQIVPFDDVDVLICASNIPKSVQCDSIKEGTTVIDCGYFVDDDFNLIGDVADYDSLKENGCFVVDANEMQEMIDVVLVEHMTLNGLTNIPPLIEKMLNSKE